MSNETPVPGNDLPLPPPTGAPVDLPAPPKKPIYRKWWFWVIVAFALLFVISALSSGGDGENASDTSNVVVEDVAAEEVVDETPVPEPEPVFVEQTTEEPAVAQEVGDEEPIDVAAGDATASDDAGADEPSAGFVFLARGDIADLAKDLDDMAIAAVEGGYFRLLGNSLELSFNIGQLESLTPPEEIAEEWTSGLAKVSKRVDAISDSLSSEGSTQQVLNRIRAAAEALVQLSEVVDRVDP